MVDLKSVIANNIIELRKSKSWTQTELAQKLNYSDKAVSKWERAESIPDVMVLKDIADLFSVTVDYFLTAEHLNNEFKIEVSKQIKRNRLIVALLSASLVLLIATVIFVIFGLLSINIGKPLGMLYVYAMPPTFIVLLVFNSIWGKRLVNSIIISFLVWSILLILYLSFNINNIWLIFIIGIPAQVIILLFATLKLKRK